MEKYAIFLDFDSTLSLHNTVSKENCEALKKVQQLGHYIFINTGRNHQGIEPIASKFHNFSGYISGLGSHITLGDSVIYHNYFDFETVERAARYFLSQSYTSIITCVDRGYIINPKNEDQKKAFTEIESVEFLRANCKNERFQKIESLYTKWTDEEMAFYKSLGTVFVHEGYTESCPFGCSKSKAIEIVLQNIPIKPENTIAMGDSSNDMDMIMAASISVAMGEAPDYMKEKADLVTKECIENGVAYALEKLILNKQ